MSILTAGTVRNLYRFRHLLFKAFRLGAQEMAAVKTQSFGRVIRERRRQLELTQEDVARRINTSVPYVGHLEAGKRHPSQKIVLKLAKALGLDGRDLFLLVNPKVGSLISEPHKPNLTSAWDAFVKDLKVRKIHHISEEEMEILSHVAMMGPVRSARDFLFILNAIRQALGR
jgi:transcriptional regulator with XRE-family HTH domain